MRQYDTARQTTVGTTRIAVELCRQYVASVQHYRQYLKCTTVVRQYVTAVQTILYNSRQYNNSLQQYSTTPRGTIETIVDGTTVRYTVVLEAVLYKH